MSINYTPDNTFIFTFVRMNPPTPGHLLLIKNLSMFEKELIIDGKGHLQGRLASIIAKELLSGQHVTVVRCEEILKSGSLKRN